MLIISILFNIYLVFCVSQMAAGKISKPAPGVILNGQLIGQEFGGVIWRKIGVIYREENLWKEKFFVGRGKVFLFLERCFEKYFYFALD